MLLAAEQKYSENNCETREDRTQITAGKTVKPQMSEQSPKK